MVCTFRLEFGFEVGAKLEPLGGDDRTERPVLRLRLQGYIYEPSPELFALSWNLFDARSEYLSVGEGARTCGYPFGWCLTRSKRGEGSRSWYSHCQRD